MTEHALYYTDTLLEKLQLRWGDGLLSPGGAAELARMLGDVSARRRAVLDLGCGLGGYDALLVRDHGAAHVTGVDIDGASIEAARARIRAEGLQEAVTFRHVAPGPLPVAAESFDMVFSKDTIVDLPDKPAALQEMFRVLRPAGALVLGDWFRADAPMTPEMRAWTYEMATLDETAAALRAAGFTGIETEDRNAWFAAYANDEYERLKGPLFETFVARFGHADAERSVENAHIRALLAAHGQLRPGHLRARRPD
jgi:phosphoethanolamine N-methyltransferase